MMSKKPLTQAQRVALLARVAEVILSDSGQSAIQTKTRFFFALQFARLGIDG